MADEEMKDAAPLTENQPSSEQPAQSIEVDSEANLKDDANPREDSLVQDDSEIRDESEIKEEDGDEDEPTGEDVVPKKKGRRWPKKEGTLDNNVYKALKSVADTLTDHKYTKRGEDYYPSILFRRIPNKRLLPDYHELIKEPRAISSLKGKIQRKEYKDVKEYVRDFALVVHNAQVYNRPNSIPVKDVKYLEKLFKDEMQKLVDEGVIKQEDLEFPDLGEIPEATPEPDIPSEPEIEEEEEEGEGEDDDEEDGDDSDEDRPKKGRKGRKSGGRRRVGEDDEEGGKGKKRGRPPKVDTPMEARIKAVLKAIRKPKDGSGALKIRHFERLPDKVQNPHYYQEIKNPIALDLIKRKAKRKKYNSLDHFMEDMKLMFANAMAYNEDASEIFQDASDLLAEALALAEAEKARPDQEFLDEDGRLPLPQGIMYKNDMWKIGEWVHIENVNDVSKPIVAQIYRTWQDTDGQKWINACWYYRPEQTVHQYEKHFYPNEVLKTGDYRDHRIEEVISKCYVMFFTKYSKGRPRDIDRDTEIYVCEARYNIEKHRINKIKTWASCLPDEVRDQQDYPMDTFDNPKKVKKVPSPLLHLLKDDAPDSTIAEAADKIEKGSSDDGPPVLGAIYKGERDENQSPPPEPTPPPPPTPPPVVRPAMLPRPPSVPVTQQQPTRVSPSMTPGISPSYPVSQPPTSAYLRQNSYQPQAPVRPYSTTPQTPVAQQSRPYVPPQQLHQPSMAAAHPTSYASSTPAQVYPRQPIAAAQPPQPQAGYPTPATHFPREQDVYVLPDHVNASIPEDIRNQFPQDDQGRVLFFTKPPVDTRTVYMGRGDRKPLKHSEKFIAYKAALQKKIAEKERLEKEGRQMDVDMPDVATTQTPMIQHHAMQLPSKQSAETYSSARVTPAQSRELMMEMLASHPSTTASGTGITPLRARELMMEVLGLKPSVKLDQVRAQLGGVLQLSEELTPEHVEAVRDCARRLTEADPEVYKQKFGGAWEEVYLADMAFNEQRRESWRKEAEKMEEQEKRFSPIEEYDYTFRGSGRFEDDYDPRYGF